MNFIFLIFTLIQSISLYYLCSLTIALSQVCIVVHEGKNVHSLWEQSEIKWKYIKQSLFEIKEVHSIVILILKPLIRCLLIHFNSLHVASRNYWSWIDWKKCMHSYDRCIAGNLIFLLWNLIRRKRSEIVYFKGQNW
jgi:hypothetical protein